MNHKNKVLLVLTKVEAGTSFDVAYADVFPKESSRVAMDRILIITKTDKSAIAFNEYQADHFIEKIATSPNPHEVPEGFFPSFEIEQGVLILTEDGLDGLQPFIVERKRISENIEVAYGYFSGLIFPIRFDINCVIKGEVIEIHENEKIIVETYLITQYDTNS